ncbi:MAG: hypothetical protein ABR506_11720 [Candidatus Krumholzibacteriia bacterium]
MRPPRRTFLRDLEAGPLLDLVLVLAVLAVLLIRFWLHLTGYPRVGGDSLHIAHMLWGGLLMLAALVMLMAFLDKHARRLAAVLGGLGFGTFIDEVGKFITKDNDYFYEPAVSVIYVVLVLLYLAGRSLARRQQASPTENLVNALRSTGEFVADDPERGERDRALAYLDASGDTGPVATALRGALAEATTADDRPAGPLLGGARRIVGAYRLIATSRWFGWALVAFFALQLVAAGLRLALILPWFAPRPVFLANVPLVTPLPPDPDQFAVADWLQLLSSLLAGVFVALGMVAVFQDRRHALRMFLRATVVTLCITQAFLFYRVEWLGLGALALNLMILAGLRFALDHDPARPPA